MKINLPYTALQASTTVVAVKVFLLMKEISARDMAESEIGQIIEQITRAAFEAMVENWPGGGVQSFNDMKRSKPHIILPMENTDD